MAVEAQELQYSGSSTDCLAVLSSSSPAPPPCALSGFSAAWSAKVEKRCKSNPFTVYQRAETIGPLTKKNVPDDCLCKVFYQQECHAFAGSILSNENWLLFSVLCF